ncbi:hypothetical protein IE81DRAFT_365690 [Ceraceosorus guamensis]|uniref:Uncharacterized protein n=1 Tax=Ceraceosorus guamensis TaxID=1522189 RepID=A0A316W0T1_9BASI|nr:hypothetical protein IE81DRAFT_365690 [Ceraceosorus guamensis]PWN43456.1 hypothetical protein IE81DRAFT_365690 [Ceraceosorus guamensis]
MVKPTTPTKRKACKSDPEGSSEQSAAPDTPSKKAKKDWTAEEEAALMKAVFDLALDSIPHLHSASGLRETRTNPSINTKPRTLRAKYEKRN